MQHNKEQQGKQHHLRYTKILLRGFLTLNVYGFCVSHSSVNAEITVNGRIDAGYTYQQLKTESNSTRSLDTFSLNPSVNAIYSSKTLNGLWSGSLTYLNRQRDEFEQTQNYGEYNYLASWTPIDFLAFEVNGFLNYRNANTSNFILSDFLTNSEDLVKTRSNRMSSTLDLTRGSWILARGSASYSDTASETPTFTTINSNALDNDSLRLSGEVASGKRFNSIYFNLSGSFEKTERDSESLEDFITRVGNAYSDINVYANWAIRLSAKHEGNQISARNGGSGSIVREFNSYGIGLTYRASELRYISLTLNKADSDDEELDNDSFIGVDMAWALSARTNLSATYGKRFFGESGSAKFSYNSKFLRASFAYTEDVTNTSRLLANQENLGVFVCPANAFSIANCFQPSSLSYIPQAGEQFVQLATQNIELQDNVILRKGANFQFGYDFSRVTVALSWLYSEDNYLDFDRLRRTFSFGSKIAYQLGKDTSIGTSLNFANITERSDSKVFAGEGDNYNASVSLNRSLGKYLAVNLDFTFLKQEGDLTSGLSAFGNNFTDRRAGLSIIYTFE